MQRLARPTSVDRLCKEGLYHGNVVDHTLYDNALALQGNIQELQTKMEECMAAITDIIALIEELHAGNPIISAWRKVLDGHIAAMADDINLVEMDDPFPT